jgi:F-type H+-transporting ATPase subunit delta
MAVAEERQRIDEVAADLESVNRTLSASRDLRLVVTSPLVRPGKKRAVFRELFGSHVGEEVRLFLDLLLTKGRGTYIPGLATEFVALRDARRGVVTAHATTVVPLSSDQEKRLRAHLEEMTGCSVRLHTMQQASIGGGLVVRIGDTIYDGSVARQLEVLRNRWAVGETPAQ